MLLPMSNRLTRKFRGLSGRRSNGRSRARASAGVRARARVSTPAAGRPIRSSIGLDTVLPGVLGFSASENTNTEIVTPKAGGSSQ